MTCQGGSGQAGLISLKALSGLVNRSSRGRTPAARAWRAGVPLRGVKKYGDDEGGPQAALITYYGFPSIFPLLLLGGGDPVPGAGRSPDLRRRLITAIVPQALRSTVEHSLATLPTSTIPLVASLRLLLSGTGVVFSAYQTLNHVARSGTAAGQLRLTVCPGVRGAGDADARGAGHRCAHVVATALPGQSGVERAAAVVESAPVVLTVLPARQGAAGPPGAGPALCRVPLGRGGGDGGAQRRGAVAGQAGGQGLTRLRQLRHRGRHVRAAVPGRPGAGVRGRSRSVRYARLWPRALDLNRPTRPMPARWPCWPRAGRIPAARIQFRLTARAPRRYRVVPRQPAMAQGNAAIPAASRPASLPKWRAGSRRC